MNKFLSILILILLIPVGTIASERDGKCTHGNCISGQGAWAFGNGIIYRGSFIDGVFEGLGELIDSNADARYTGEFENDRPNGNGVLKWTDGTTFEGSFKNGTLINGQKTTPDGTKIKIQLNAEEISKLNKPEKAHAIQTSESSKIFFYSFIAALIIAIAAILKVAFSIIDKFNEKRKEGKKTSQQKLRDKMLFMNLFNLKRAGKIEKKDHAAYDALVDEKNRTMKS